jgi:hypothetical protein
VPLVFPGSGEKLAPAGSPVADSEAIAGPSASDAVTVTVSRVPSVPLAVAGAVTTGGWSSPPEEGTIVMLVELEPLSALLAVKVTV